uniref:Blue copper protein n=1 Tax=Anthurium amnicola TaxID=1678845 RepID=A0A1D1YLE9_9ARAE
MKRAVAIFLIIASLVALAHAADVPVKVGGATAGINTFDPQMVMANPGDNVVFTWQSGMHSVLESDAAKSCVKSAKPNAFSSGGAFAAPKTWTYNVPANATGKTWFYCGVPGHCEGGMYGTLVIGGTAAPGGGANGTAPGGAMPSMPATPSEGGAGAAPSAKSAASRNYNSFAAGVALSSMCLAAAYIL